MKNPIMTGLGLVALFPIALPAMAQSNVTVYGVLDLGVEAGRTGGTGFTRVDTSAVAPVRLGFQGTEDLGGGTQAIFRLESGFNADTGTLANNGALFGREAWAGLKGDFGQVQVGVNYTPLFLSYVTYAMGQLNTLGWGNATNNFVFVPAARASNSIRYTSPSFAGFTLRAFHGRGNEDAAGQPRGLGKTSGAGLAYKHARLSVDLDYMQQDYSRTPTPSASTPAQTGRYYLVGASYDFGLVKPAFLYQAHRGSAGVTAANNASFANPDNHFFELDALIRVTTHGTVLVSYGEYKLRENSAGNAKSYALRHDYALSKRTGLYAGVTRVANGSAASFSAAPAQGPGMSVAPGNGINSAIVGMIHRF
ncbi:porin [uncultured Massilia sp.]|uniref:porin n=1 Tax=uncultured Massilia sp. TaxID=169973 RepID=UPI0025E80780|nr:porin [uncultured Massilia sp.]